MTCGYIFHTPWKQNSHMFSAERETSDFGQNHPKPKGVSQETFFWYLHCVLQCNPKQVYQWLPQGVSRIELKLSQFASCLCLKLKNDNFNSTEITFGHIRQISANHILTTKAVENSPCQAKPIRGLFQLSGISWRRNVSQKYMYPLPGSSWRWLPFPGDQSDVTFFSIFRCISQDRIELWIRQKFHQRQGTKPFVFFHKTHHWIDFPAVVPLSLQFLKCPEGGAARSSWARTMTLTNWKCTKECFWPPPPEQRSACVLNNCQARAARSILSCMR